MAFLMRGLVFLVCSILLQLTVNSVFGQNGHCNHEDTGLYVYNTAICQFFRCDGGQQVRLRCKRDKIYASSSPSMYTPRIRATLDNYYNFGMNKSLYLELIGTSYPRDSNGYSYVRENSLDESLLGPSKKFVHKLRIETADTSYINQSVWSQIPALKILEISLTEQTTFPTPSFLKGLNGLESLVTNFGPQSVIFNPLALSSLPSLQCFQIEGSNLFCDCQLQNFVARSRLKPLAEQFYLNPFMTSGGYTNCTEHNRGICGSSSPGQLQGKTVTAALFPDCPNTPQKPATTESNSAFNASSVSCDFTNLYVQLHNVEALQAGMEVSLGRSFDEKCQGIRRNDSIDLSSHIQDCGTRVILNEETSKVELSNMVVVRWANAADHINSQVIQPADIATLEVKCVLGYQAEISDGMEGGIPMHLTIQWEGQVRTRLEILPQTSNLGFFNFEISLESSPDTGKNWLVSVENCWATSSSDANDSLRYDLIKNRCALDSSLKCIEKRPDDGQSVHYQYSMRPFQFSAAPNASVFIHCEVAPCTANNEFCKNSGKLEMCAADDFSTVLLGMEQGNRQIEKFWPNPGTDAALGKLPSFGAGSFKTK